MKIRFWCRGQIGVRSSQVEEKLWKVNGMEWKIRLNVDTRTEIIYHR